MTRFPDVGALAAAPLDDVLAAWSRPRLLLRGRATCTPAPGRGRELARRAAVARLRAARGPWHRAVTRPGPSRRSRLASARRWSTATSRACSHGCSRSRPSQISGGTTRGVGASAGADGCPARAPCAWRSQPGPDGARRDHAAHRPRHVASRARSRRWCATRGRFSCRTPSHASASDELPILAHAALWIEHAGELVLARRKPGGLFGGLWELPQATTRAAITRALRAAHVDPIAVAYHEQTLASPPPAHRSVPRRDARAACHAC